MATQSTLVDNDGFTRLIEETPDAKPYQMGSYLYLTRREKNGWQTYRTLSVNWQAVATTTAATNNPAAGAGTYTTITVPAGRRWLFMGASLTVTTDANVADRRFYMNIAPNAGATTIAAIDPNAIPASQTAASCSFVPGAASGEAATATTEYHTVGVGQNHEINAGGTIIFGLIGVQATDDLAAGYYAYKEVLL